MWSLQQVARKSPGRVYEKHYGAWDNTGGCYYQWQGKPDCGIGQALSLLGVSVGVLSNMDSQDAPGINSVAIDNVYITEYALLIFTVFQMAQDAGWPWESALQFAQKASKKPGMPVEAYVP